LEAGFTSDWDRLRAKVSRSDWRRPKAPWPLVVGLILLHAFAGMVLWSLSDFVYSSADEGSQGWDQINAFRVGSVVVVLGLVPAWRGRWSLWLASVAVPLAFYPLTVFSG